MLDGPDSEVEEYPGLIVWSKRVTGSITAGHSRLPLWCFVSQAMVYGWEQEVRGNYDPEQYGWTRKKMGDFLYNLLEQRGEFGRLICMLADVERREEARGGALSSPAWWEVKSQRKRMAAQLRRCLAVVEDAG